MGRGEEVARSPGQGRGAGVGAGAGPAPADPGPSPAGRGLAQGRGGRTQSRDRGPAAAAERRLPNRSPGRAVAARGPSRGPSPSRGPAPSPRARDLQAGETARTGMQRSPKATQNHARDRQLRRMETPGDRDQGPPPRMGTPLPTRMATLLGTIEQLRTHLEIFKGIFSIFTQQAIVHKIPLVTNLYI